MIARWRRRAADADPELLANRVQLCREASGEFGRWWDSHNVQEHRSRLRHFRHPQHGIVTLWVVVVDSAELADHFVVYHAPADARDNPAPEPGAPQER